MILVCRFISQDHVIKRPCDFMGRSPSRQITILKNFSVYRHLGVGNIMVFNCHVTLQDRMIKALRGFIVTIRPGFVAISLVAL